MQQNLLRKNVEWDYIVNVAYIARIEFRNDNGNINMYCY